MARRASGDEEVLMKARQAIASAQTVEQLRQAQAVVLPLDFGLSLVDTAALLGLSPYWVCRLRRRFMQGRIAGSPDAPAAVGRRHQNLTVEQEREVLAPFLSQAATGGVLVVAQIKAALDQRVGRPVALASAYSLLHRHGWRKLVPDKRHPKSNPAAQAEWKKNSAKRSATSAAAGRKALQSA